MLNSSLTIQYGISSSSICPTDDLSLFDSTAEVGGGSFQNSLNLSTTNDSGLGLEFASDTGNEACVVGALIIASLLTNLF